MPRDGAGQTVHAHIMRRVEQGLIRPEEAAELGERLSLIASMQELGAISPRFADWLITAIAEEQAALWLDRDEPAANRARNSIH
jgi:hypothetical protein